MDLLAIIWSAVKAPIAASMQGVAAVTTSAVEARLAVDDRRRGLYIIMISHLRHICGVAGDDNVHFICREMALLLTKAEGLALMFRP